MSREALKESISKAIADAAGHGLREKCERHADAVLDVLEQRDQAIRDAAVRTRVVDRADAQSLFKEEDVARLWKVAREHDCTIPDEALDAMRAALIASLAAPSATVQDRFVKVGTARTEGCMHFTYLPWSVKDGEPVYAAIPDGGKNG